MEDLPKMQEPPGITSTTSSDQKVSKKKNGLRGNSEAWQITMFKGSSTFAFPVLFSEPVASLHLDLEPGLVSEIVRSAKLEMRLGDPSTHLSDTTPLRRTTYFIVSTCFRTP